MNEDKYAAVMSTLSTIALIIRLVAEGIRYLMHTRSKPAKIKKFNPNDVD